MSEGVYVSGRRRAGRRRRVAGIAAGLVVVLGGGTYAVTTWLAGRDATVSGDTGALAPIVPDAPTPPPYPSTLPANTPEPPAPGIGPGTKSAARQSSRPSPLPSPSPMTDDELAAAQVSRLLEPRPAGARLTAAGDQVTVRNEMAPDGSNVRVVSARYDLTGRWKLLWAADQGQQVGASRCTQNFRTGEQPVAQARPGLLLCWRTSAAKSVVAVATGRPEPFFTAAIVAREWANLG